MTDPTESTTRSPEDKHWLRRSSNEPRAMQREMGRLWWVVGRLTKNVLRGSLEAEMTEHLGYDKQDPAWREKGSNSRSGTRSSLRRLAIDAADAPDEA